MENFDRHLRYFLKIADSGSLSRAAEALDLTQSGLSRQLATLEAYVGKPLFLRTGRGVELTEVGQKLRSQTQPAYQAVDIAVESMRALEGISQGTVRLATMHTLSNYFLGDVTARFMNQYERVNLSLMGRSSPDVVQLVEEGRADLGFVYDSAVVSPEVVSTALFDDEMCLIVQERSDIGDHVDLTKNLPKLVGFPPHYALRRMVHSSGLHPHFAAEAEMIDVILKLVSLGIGASILPAWISDKLLVDYRLRKVAITQPRLYQRVVAIVRAGRTPSPLVRQLIDIAVAIAAVNVST